MLDIPSTQRGRLTAALERAARVLESFAPGYQLNPQDLGVIFSDNVTDILHVDMLQLQLALRELVELNRDQLDGIYNLPSDATFFVPWMAWELAARSAQNRGGGLSATKEESATDQELKAFLDQDIRNGREMLEYLKQISEAGKKEEEIKLRLVEPYITDENFKGSVSNIEEGMRNLGDYLYEKFAPFLQMEHGPVSNLDQQLENYYSREEERSKLFEEFIKSYHGSVSNIDEVMRNFDRWLQTREQSQTLGSEKDTNSVLDQILRAIDSKLERFNIDIQTDTGEVRIPSLQEFIEAIKSLDIKTDLNLNLMQTVQLEVDGKVLYAQLMNYMYRDLLSRSKSSSVVRINNLI